MRLSEQKNDIVSRNSCLVWSKPSMKSSACANCDGLRDLKINRVGTIFARCNTCAHKDGHAYFFSNLLCHWSSTRYTHITNKKTNKNEYNKHLKIQESFLLEHGRDLLQDLESRTGTWEGGWQPPDSHINQVSTLILSWHSPWVIQPCPHKLSWHKNPSMVVRAGQQNTILRAGKDQCKAFL